MWRPRGVHMSSSPTNQNSNTVRAGDARGARSCRHHNIILRQAVAEALVALVVAATDATKSGWGRPWRWRGVSPPPLLALPAARGGGCAGDARRRRRQRGYRRQRAAATLVAFVATTADATISG